LICTAEIIPREPKHKTFSRPIYFLGLSQRFDLIVGHAERNSVWKLRGLCFSDGLRLIVSKAWNGARLSDDSIGHCVTLSYRSTSIIRPACPDK
jgi:hypothetical protein